MDAGFFVARLAKANHANESRNHRRPRDRPRTRAHLRHDPARRRAGAGLFDEPQRRSGASPRPWPNSAWTSSRPASPHASDEDFASVQAIAARGARPDHLRPGPLPDGRYRSRGPRPGAGAARPHPCVHRHQPAAPRAQAGHEQAAGHRRRRRRRASRPRSCATTWNFPPKTPCAPSRNTWPR